MTGQFRNRIRFVLLIFSVFSSLFAAAYLFETSHFFKPLKTGLQEPRIPAGMLDNGALGKIIKNLDLVEVVKNDGIRFPSGPLDETDETGNPGPDIDAIAFQRKRKPSQLLYRPLNSHPYYQHDPHDSVKSIVQKGDWPILSISIPERSLYDPDIGLLKNRDKYGRNWERKADVVFYDKGEILFASPAGLRVHGGSRRTTKPYQNYRLYFRSEYGKDHIPPGIILHRAGKIYTLVIHRTDWPPGQPMNNPLAYDISRHIGVPVPQTRLFELYINGQSEGMAFVTEHLSRRQFDQYMTSKNYIFRKYKNHISPTATKAYFNKLWRYVIQLDESTYPVLEKVMDIDRFTRHIFSWVFNGNEDHCQGVGVLDSDDPAAKFYWIEWDMDHSYFDRTALLEHIDRENWEQSALGLIYNDDEKFYCDRTYIFNRLIETVPGFKTYAINLFTEIINHQLTDDFLTSKVNYYSSMISAFDDYSQYIEMLRLFMANRSDFIRTDLAERFKVSGPFALTVTGDKNYEFFVDGYKYRYSYEGKYFAGQEVKISLNSDQPPGNFSHWSRNGEFDDSQVLHISMDADTDIEMVFKKAAPE